ncbi:MAG: hypothetical protein KF760_04550 [Candidatus Eremiobacteraeota bacterium]|nr:hypothetical protein [Candidatus Eremiobacteraeota bacterium]MCW5866943.1 hypothetical protein [Candidatus Eremiobacteraeota bacterium]
MMRNLLIVLGFMLCFVVGGVGVSRYLSSQGKTPFLKASAADLVGTWRNKATELKVEASGDTLMVDRADYVRDGKAARWVEKTPQTKVPRVLEWNGSTLQLTTVDDTGQRRSEILEKARK